MKVWHLLLKYQVSQEIMEAINNYQADQNFNQMHQLTQLTINEREFAQVLGKYRLH